MSSSPTPLARGKHTLPAEIVWCEIIRTCEIKLINQPSMAKRTVGHIGNSKLSRGVNQTIRLVQCLKCRVFGLDSIDFRDCYSLSAHNLIGLRTLSFDSLELAFFSVDAEHSERPIYFVFPCFRISSSAVIDSSRGVSVINAC